MSVSVLDTSTKKLHVFPLTRGGEDTTMKEFVKTVEDTLTRALGSPGSCVCVLCAAVGEVCVNICDRQRTVQYYLLDAKPWFVKTGVFSDHHANVHVRDTTTENGDEAAIKITDLERSCVKDLKQMFAKMTCAFFPNLRFMFDERELENDKKMSYYNLTNGCVVRCQKGKRGGLFRLGTPCMYVPTLGGGVRNGEFNKLSPVWRTATPGLWLEGKCCNKICVAYSKLVVMNQGFTDLDLMGENRGCKCPMCYEKVIPTAYGFSRCEWMTVGLKQTSSLEHPQVVRQDWQRLEEGYCYFVLSIDLWSIYKISSRELTCPEFCMLCMATSKSYFSTTTCGHTVHSSCEEADLECLQCIGDKNMTQYQNCFS